MGRISAVLLPVLGKFSAVLAGRITAMVSGSLTAVVYDWITAAFLVGLLL